MLAHELRLSILLRHWTHAHRSFPTMLPEGLGQQVSSGSACPWAAPLPVFPLWSHSHDLIAPTQTPELEGFSFSITEKPGLSNFHHCCNSMISYIFFLNWGPSRTSICHGVTISSYLPDGEQFRSWTTKVLPIKLGHINKLSYILLITLLSVSRK